MRRWVVGLVFVVACVMAGSVAKAQCPDYRPCGPGPTFGGNRLIKQGFFGADFRPSCQQHDTCNGTDRECDRMFLKNMYSACATSSHPRRCRAKARHYFLVSRIYHSIPRVLRPTLGGTTARN